MNRPVFLFLLPILTALAFLFLTSSCGQDYDTSPVSEHVACDHNPGSGPGQASDDDDDNDDDDAAAPLTLTLIHTNDTHSHIRQFNSYGTDCSEEEEQDGECYGGVARRAAEADRIRDEQQNVLFLDAGDQFQGTLFYTVYQGEATWTFMNLLGYDLMALGNHEFDNGPEVLGPFVDQLDFPVVCANADFSGEPLLAGKIKPYVIFNVNEHQVGVVGWVTPETATLSQPGPTVAFSEIEPAVEAAVEELTRQGVDIIIGLSHAGYERDQEIAAAVDGLDAIVGGHSHTLLSNTDENAAGPYPTEVDSPGGQPVLIVTAAQWGLYLGELTIQFDADGVADTWTGEPILLDSSIEQDAQTLALVEDFGGQIDEFAGEKIGETAVDLDGAEESCRFGECLMGDFIADIMLWENQTQSIQIALINGGAIKSSIPAGDVTMGQVLTVFPYQNSLATLGLLGSDLLLALEYGVSRAEDPANEGTGRFLQVAGMRYEWDPGEPEGSRIISVDVLDENSEFQPLDTEAVYQVVTVDYLRGGGDGFTVFEENAIDPYDYGRLLTDAILDYFKLFSPVNPELDGRISTPD